MTRGCSAGGHPADHRGVRISFAIGMLVAALAFPAAASADDAIIVKRVAGLDRAERAAVRDDADVKLDETLTLPNTEVVSPQAGRRSTRRSTRSTTNPDVVYAEPDRPGRARLKRPAVRQPVGPEQHRADGLDGRDAGRRHRRARGLGDDARRGRDRRRRRHRASRRTHPDLAGQWTGNPGERGGGKETNGVDDDHNGFVDDWQGWDFVNNDNTAGVRRATSTARTSRARSRRWPTTASASPASRRRPRSCR